MEKEERLGRWQVEMRSVLDSEFGMLMESHMGDFCKTAWVLK